MYCLKLTEKIENSRCGASVISILTSDGWTDPTNTIEGILDIKNPLLFTKREAELNKKELPVNMEFVWYGAYAPLPKRRQK